MDCPSVYLIIQFFNLFFTGVSSGLPPQNNLYSSNPSPMPPPPSLTNGNGGTTSSSALRPSRPSYPNQAMPPQFPPSTSGPAAAPQPGSGGFPPSSQPGNGGFPPSSTPSVQGLASRLGNYSLNQVIFICRSKLESNKI